MDVLIPFALLGLAFSPLWVGWAWDRITDRRRDRELAVLADPYGERPLRAWERKPRG